MNTVMGVHLAETRCALQADVDAILLSVFDQLALDLGVGYAESPKELLERFGVLLKAGMLPMLCAKKCVPFRRGGGLEPYEMSPCGHLVCGRALREAEPGSCPVCGSRVESGEPQVNERALRRAEAHVRLREHRSPLPPRIQLSKVIQPRDGVTYLTSGGDSCAGVVCTARWAPEGGGERDVAVKEIPVSTSAQRRLALQQIATAFEASRGVGTRGVCKVYGYCEKVVGSVTRSVSLVMERCAGDLAGKVASGDGGKLSAPEAARIGAELARHLAQLHDELHVWHLALKPSNILVRGNGDVVLSDFRSAVNAVTRRIQTMLGPAVTEPFTSPEQQQGVMRASSDVYSLGCLIVYMLTGEPPRSAHDIPRALPMRLQQLLVGMMHVSSYARPAMSGVRAALTTIARQLGPATETEVCFVRAKLRLLRCGARTGAKRFASQVLCQAHDASLHAQTACDMQRMLKQHVHLCCRTTRRACSLRSAPPAPGHQSSRCFKTSQTSRWRASAPAAPTCWRTCCHRCTVCSSSCSPTAFQPAAPSKLLQRFAARRCERYTFVASI